MRCPERRPVTVWGDALPMLLAIVLCNAVLAASPASDSGPIPSDAELEAAGARIGTIEIRTNQIFNRDQPGEGNWLYQEVNRLHKRTRESTIRAQLLFRSGDLYSRRLLDETARNMRGNAAFLREPEILPVRYHDGLVDIEVLTNDVWTLSPAVNFGRSGGTNSTNFNVSDANLLGFGKSGEVGHSTTIDRNSSFASWNDPNIWGSRWQDSLQYANNSDGKVWNVGAGLPFYALETPWAAVTSIGDSRSLVTRYSLGEAYDAYALDWRVVDINVGKALLVSDRWTIRTLVGWRRDDSQFTLAPNQALVGPLPQDRNLSYPYARVNWIENAYETTRNLDQIAFTEDLHFGLNASIGVGYVSPAFGADRHALVADSELSHGWHFGPNQILLATMSVTGRMQSGELQDALASATANYYLTTSPATKFVIKVAARAGYELDIDHFLQLGGDTGLRGYPLRYQSGSDSALLTLEERMYTQWFPFRLVQVGGAVFFDAGRTWGYSPIPTPELGLLKDIGAGLRLGNARSSFGNVIHIDLAVPLDAQASIDKVQFLVSTERTF
jgi:hypothetical protein